MVPQPLPLEIEMALVTPVLNVLLSVELQVAIVLLGILTRFKPSIFGKLAKNQILLNFSGLVYVAFLPIVPQAQL